MSRPGITYQEVANAAIQLQGQDENPTVDRVREILETVSKSIIEKRSNAKLSERNVRLSQQLIDQKAENEKLHQLFIHVQINLEHYQASVQKLHEEQVLSAEKQKIDFDREKNSFIRI